MTYGHHPLPGVDVERQVEQGQGYVPPVGKPQGKGGGQDAKCQVGIFAESFPQAYHERAFAAGAVLLAVAEVVYHQQRVN